MKTLLLGLFAFTTVFLLSSAFPQDTGNDEPRSLVESRAGEKYLQRRRPPPNIPGPKLLPKERYSAPLPGIYENDEKSKKHLLYNPEKGRIKHAKLTKNRKYTPPLKKAASNDENLVSGVMYSSDRNEKENQRRGRFV